MKRLKFFLFFFISINSSRHKFVLRLMEVRKFWLKSLSLIILSVQNFFLLSFPLYSDQISMTCSWLTRTAQAGFLTWRLCASWGFLCLHRFFLYILMIFSIIVFLCCPAAWVSGDSFSLIEPAYSNNPQCSVWRQVHFFFKLTISFVLWELILISNNVHEQPL